MALRWQLLGHGFEIHRVSPEKSNDSREIYDGVPSSHDAKCAAIVAWLHCRGKSEPWPVKSEHERSLKAAPWLLEVGMASSSGRTATGSRRSLPAIGRSSRGCWTSTRPQQGLLAAYGGQAQVAAPPTVAAELMRRIGGSMLQEAKVEAVVAGASKTTGLPPVAEEVALVRAIAAEARRNQREERSARRRVEELAVAEEGSAKEMQAVVGKTTGAGGAAAGDPRSYESPQGAGEKLGAQPQGTEQRGEAEPRPPHHETRLGRGEDVPPLCPRVPDPSKCWTKAGLGRVGRTLRG